MKKLVLLLILSFFSVQSFAGSCPDGSEPVKSVSDDGSYFEINCSKSSNNASMNNKNPTLDYNIKLLDNCKRDVEGNWTNDITRAKYMYVVGENGNCDYGLGNTEKGALNDCLRIKEAHNLVGSCVLYGKDGKVVMKGYSDLSWDMGDEGGGYEYTALPTKAGEFPSKKQCNDLFKDQVVVNNIQNYINLHADADFDVRNNRLYSFVSKSGSVARNGPFSLWLYDELYQIATKFRPKNFEKVARQGIDWKDYENFENALCNAHLGSGTIREVLISSNVLWGRGKDWSGFAGSWESFPYIETGRKVIKSPSPKGLSHYKKYIAAGGVIIVGGSNVPDGAFYSSYDAVMYMTSEWPGVREKLKQNEARISLFYGPNTSELPEYSNEEEPGGFSMGLTDTSMTANASWLCFPGNWNKGGNPVIHELVHSLNHIVFETTNETYFYERVYDLALSAIERGIYGDFEQHLQDGEEQDISHLVGEYWAISVEGYIMNRGPRFKSSHYSREWIKENDPGVYELIRRYYPKADWTYCPGVENHM
jgi:hypothetical protein